VYIQGGTDQNRKSFKNCNVEQVRVLVGLLCQLYHHRRFVGVILCLYIYIYIYIYKGKAVPLQAWSGPDGSRKLRFPDFMTTAQDGGKVVSLTHRSPLPAGNTLVVLISVRG